MKMKYTKHIRRTQWNATIIKKINQNGDGLFEFGHDGLNSFKVNLLRHVKKIYFINSKT